TYRELAGELPAGRDLFADDDGSSHEAAINGLAALGVVAGTGEGAYEPGSVLNRAQAATMVARLLDALVEAGVAEQGHPERADSRGQLAA
ncbi:MAG: S-layer homology domain-containing protein, partial [Trueperaceae bacterium]